VQIDPWTPFRRSKIPAVISDGLGVVQTVINLESLCAFAVIIPRVGVGASARFVML
jgi:hypothetical protein